MSHPIRRIMVALKDLEVTAGAPARKAAQLARGLNAELIYFHALTGPLYVETLSLSKHPVNHAEAVALAAAKARLDKVASPLKSEGLNIGIEAAWDYPAHDAVIRAALRLHADLVVIDCPRHTHTAAWFLQFTDWELLRNCPLPVLLIKNHGQYRRAPVLAALDPAHASGKPAGLDADILDYGSQLAAALDDHLHAVHAFNPIPHLPASALIIPQVVAEAEQQAYEKAHNALDPALDESGVTQNRRHIEEGFAIDVIEKVASMTGAQILVMGAISRSGLKRLLIGNTAERMLDRLTCDMLIVKPADFRHPVSDLPRGAQIVPTPALAAAIQAIS